MCSSRKYPCPPQGRLTEIPRRRAISKVLFFEGKYDTKMEFSEGWGVQTKKPSVEGVDIFWNNTISSLVIGFKMSYFPLIRLPSRYRTVCYWIVCYWTVCYRTV